MILSLDMGFSEREVREALKYNSTQESAVSWLFEQREKGFSIGSSSQPSSGNVDLEPYPHRKVTADEWFKNVAFEAAGFNAQENVVLENMEADGELQKGFLGPDILVTEGKTNGRCSLGTCFLLQNPSTWGEEDKSMRRF